MVHLSENDLPATVPNFTLEAGMHRPTIDNKIHVPDLDKDLVPQMTEYIAWLRKQGIQHGLEIVDRLQKQFRTGTREQCIQALENSNIHVEPTKILPVDAQKWNVLLTGAYGIIGSEVYLLRWKVSQHMHPPASGIS